LWDRGSISYQPTKHFGFSLHQQRNASEVSNHKNKGHFVQQLHLVKFFMEQWEQEIQAELNGISAKIL
jgi:hypothetical protein